MKDKENKNTIFPAGRRKQKLSVAIGPVASLGGWKGAEDKNPLIGGAEKRAERHAGVRRHPCCSDWWREPGEQGPAGASVSLLDPTAVLCGDRALQCLG